MEIMIKKNCTERGYIHIVKLFYLINNQKKPSKPISWSIYINGLEVVSMKSRVKDMYPLFFFNKTRLKTNALPTELKGIPTSQWKNGSTN